MEAWSFNASPVAGETRMDFGWGLAKFAWRSARSSRTLIALGLPSALLAGTAGLANLTLSAADHEISTPALIAVLFAAMIAAVFLQVALALAADDVIDGEGTTAPEALAEAKQRLRAILAWAAIAASLLLALAILAHSIPQRFHLLLSLINGAWAFGTVFVVPMLALDLSSPLEALRESPHLIKHRWGEAFAGLFGIGGIAAVASIPAGILLAAGSSRNHSHPGAGDPAIVIGVIGVVALVALASVTVQVFSVALFRDATLGFPDSRAYVDCRPRRKSWIVRIGIVLAVGLLALGLVGMILGPTAKSGNAAFRIAAPAGYATVVTAGMPVVYEGQAIGEVTAAEASEGREVIYFEIESRYSSLKSSTTISLAEFDGHPCLIILNLGEAPPTPGQDVGVPQGAPA